MMHDDDDDGDDDDGDDDYGYDDDDDDDDDMKFTPAPVRSSMHTCYTQRCDRTTWTRCESCHSGSFLCVCV